MTSTPTVFLSHSHLDKRATRRLARELRAYGFRVWIDEAELRLGTVLSPSLRAHIDEVDVVVVVASTASAESTWVAQEVAHALERGKLVVPFYIAPLATIRAFSDHLGVDASSPTEFVGSVRRLIAGLLPTGEGSFCAPDLSVLEADLRNVASEEPDLRLLIEDCLDRDGSHVSVSALTDSDFHPLDYALHALVEVTRSNVVASVAAEAFRRRGAGAEALMRWIAISGDGDLPLVRAVGDELDASLLDRAIELLRSCDPPNNHALCNFIVHNGEQLSPAQRRATLALVVWPQRGPERMGDILGGLALAHLPGSPEVLNMWTRWIHGRNFDIGTECGPVALARALSIAERDNVRGLDKIHEALRSHVRALLRSGDAAQVTCAVDHLTANADEDTGALAALCTEASGVSATAEWESWAKKEPERANDMAHYVFAHLSHVSDRDWLKAMEDYRQAVEFDDLRRRLLRDERT